MIQAETLKILLQQYCERESGVWERVEALLEPIRRKPNQAFFTQGEACERGYFLQNGLIKLSYQTFEGREYVKSFIAEGQFFGSLSSLLAARPAPFSALPLEPSLAWGFSWLDFQAAFGGHHGWDRMRADLFADLALAKEGREYELLCLDAPSRLAAFEARYGHLSERLRQTQIAAYLGITPVALSRIKHRKP